MGSDRILIVGGGVAGLATAWSLARRGAKDVVLVERERELARHSSRKNAAILRSACTDPRLETITERAAEFLRSPLRGFSAAPLVDACGMLIAAGPRGGVEAAWEQRALARSVAAEVDASRARSLAPHFAAADERCLHFPRDGRIDIEALLGGFEQGARASGVRFDLGTGVRELLVHGGAVAGARLADGREVRAERTVIAAGGWADALGAAAGSRVKLRPTRRHLVVTRSDARIDPRGPIVWVEDEPFYARPEAGGALLCPCDEVDAAPDAVDALPEMRDLALERARRWLPDLAPHRPERFWSGIRTLTEDGLFVIGPDADVEGLFWAAGLGGHGMGCAYAVGEIAAASVLGDSDEGAIAGADACTPSRFTRPTRVHS